MDKTTEIKKEDIKKPEAYQNPKCTCCGREEELRMGWCFDCADFQAMLVDGETMYDESVEDWTKTEILTYIVRKAMNYNK